MFKNLPPPSPNQVPLPPTSLPETTNNALVESAQNNLIWALLSMLGFVALLIGGLALLYIRSVPVDQAFITIIATITGAAMTQIGKVIESVAGLLSRTDSRNEKINGSA